MSGVSDIRREEMRQGLGRLEEALEQFELCLKLKIEQGSPQHTEESIQETETKIAQFKELMNG